MKMQKKFITLLLSFVMVFTMVVPTFAAQNTLPAPKWDGIKYMALGDSIGAGCKNVSGGPEEAEYTKYIYNNDQDGKDWTYSVSYAYPTLVNKAIGNKWNSKKCSNGTYPALRAKDYCQILDYLTGTNYYQDYLAGDSWGAMIKLMYSRLFGNEVKEEYKNRISEAELITIELGSNEFSAFLLNAFAKDDFGAIGEIITSVSNAIGKSSHTIQILANIVTELKNMKSFEQFGPVMNEVAKYMGELYNTDLPVYKELVKTIDSTIIQAARDYRKYFDMLMSGIRTDNPNATIIVTTVPNPAVESKTLAWLTGAIIGEINKDAASAIDAENAIMLFVNDMNSYIYNNASKYNYRVADLSDVVINAFEENEKYYDASGNITRDGVDYSFHPNAENHKKIANAIIKQYTAAVAEKTVKTVKKVVKKIKEPETVFCKHENTVVKNKVVATYLTAGFTGNKVCKDCGEVVTAGQIIPRKTLGLADKIFTKDNIQKVTDLFKKLIPARSK